MTASDLEGIKAILDVHMQQIRGELKKLSDSSDSIRSHVERIDRESNVAIARIEKDVTALATAIRDNKEEIKSIKRYNDVNEESQQTRWEEQSVLNDRDKTTRDWLKWVVVTFGGFLAYYVFTQLFH